MRPLAVRGLAALLLALLAVAGCAGNAWAHATLVSAEPGDGSVLAVAPKMVQLRFNEPVAPAVVQLIDARGRVRTDAVVRARDAFIDIVVPDNLPEGTQVVSYRIISADGHPVSGALVFSVGAVTGRPVADTVRSTATLGALIWLARWGIYLGLFVGIGGGWFRTWIAPGWEGAAAPGGRLDIRPHSEEQPQAASRRMSLKRFAWASCVETVLTDLLSVRDTVCRCISERILKATLLVGLLSAIAGLGLQGLDLLGLPLARIVTVAPWRAALTTSLGPALLIALGAIVLAAVADRCRPLAVMRVASSVAMAGIGASLAASGHASTASPQWLMRMSVFVHGVCVAYWVGALLPLLGMLGRQSCEVMLPVLLRFSRGAVAAVGLLVLTGTVLAMVQMARFGALVDTAYGRLLAAKLVLVLALLGLAALNRWRLTPALAGAGQTDGCAAARLKYSIAGEIVIVLAILGVVAGWRFTPPPRALAAAAQSELSVHLHTAKGMVQVTITPGTSGNNTFDLQFMNEDLTPLKIVDASIVLTEPERGIAPISRPASRLADDRWVVRDVPLPFSGRWRLRVRGFITDFDELSVEDAFEVP